MSRKRTYEEAVKSLREVMKPKDGGSPKYIRVTESYKQVVAKRV